MIGDGRKRRVYDYCFLLVGEVFTSTSGLSLSRVLFYGDGTTLSHAILKSVMLEVLPRVIFRYQALPRVTKNPFIAASLSPLGKNRLADSLEIEFWFPRSVFGARGTRCCYFGVRG